MRRALFGMLAFAAACATTDVRGTWTADERPESIGRTLVVGLSEEETWAHSFESRTVRRLRAAGVDAVPLSELEHNGLRQKSADESRAEIEALVDEHGFDTILVGHLSGTEIEVEPVPLPYVAFGPWWGSAWGDWWYGPGFVYPYFGYGGPAYTVDRRWRVETRLFEAHGDRSLIWSMVATTTEEPLAALSDIAEATVEQLGRVRLLPGGV